MNENGRSKSDLFYMIIMILTLITMVVGITFTYFSLLSSEKKDSTIIKTGTLSINYVGGNEINAYDLMPINEPNLSTVYSVYRKDFSVVSDGTLDQNLNIFITVTKNEFKDSALRYSLYDNNNNKISTGGIPSSGKVRIASDVFLKSGDRVSYKVLIWLQEDNTLQDYEQGHVFAGGFSIDATQIKYE